MIPPGVHGSIKPTSAPLHPLLRVGERVLVRGPGLGDHRDVGRLVAGAGGGAQLRGDGGGRVSRLGQRGISTPGPWLLNGEAPLERLGRKRRVGDAADGAEGGVDPGPPGAGGLVLRTDLHGQSVGGEQLVWGQAPEQM